jgi:hypothetical protein
MMHRTTCAVLLATLLGACSTFGVASSPSPTPLIDVVYNRTEATVEIAPGYYVGPCASLRVVIGESPPAMPSPLPSAIALSPAGLAPPNGGGIVNVVLTSNGTQYSVGEIDPASLPPCSGQPRLYPTAAPS